MTIFAAKRHEMTIRTAESPKRTVPNCQSVPIWVEKVALARKWARGCDDQPHLRRTRAIGCHWRQRGGCAGGRCRAGVNGVPGERCANERCANGTHQMAREHGGRMAKRERGGVQGGRGRAEADARGGSEGAIWCVPMARPMARHRWHASMAPWPNGSGCHLVCPNGTQWHNAWRPWHNGVLVGGCERRQPRLRRERKAAMGSTRTPRRLALTAKSPWMLAT